MLYQSGVKHFYYNTQASDASDHLSPDDLEVLLEPFIQMMSQMQATQPGVVRGIRTSRVLQRSPWLWSRGKLSSLHAFTEVTTQLDEFWSHSWQTKPWIKYVSLVFLSNGLPAFILGTLCALAGFSAQAAGLVVGNWCTASGAVGYYMTLLLLAPQGPCLCLLKFESNFNPGIYCTMLGVQACPRPHASS